MNTNHSNIFCFIYNKAETGYTNNQISHYWGLKVVLKSLHQTK